jgi:hypothetical protein
MSRGERGGCVFHVGIVANRAAIFFQAHCVRLFNHRMVQQGK